METKQEFLDRFYEHYEEVGQFDIISSFEHSTEDSGGWLCEFENKYIFLYGYKCDTYTDYCNDEIFDTLTEAIEWLKYHDFKLKWTFIDTISKNMED